MIKKPIFCLYKRILWLNNLIICSNTQLFRETFPEYPTITIGIIVYKTTSQTCLKRYACLMVGVSIPRREYRFSKYLGIAIVPSLPRKFLQPYKVPPFDTRSPSTSRNTTSEKICYSFMFEFFLILLIFSMNIVIITIRIIYFPKISTNFPTKYSKVSASALRIYSYAKVAFSYSFCTTWTVTSHVKAARCSVFGVSSTNK